MKIHEAHGGTWRDHQKELVEKGLLTPEEICASDARAAIMAELIKARNENKISQQKLEELTGVRQAVISRMERGETTPKLDTVLKVLATLGLTLVVAPISEK